MVQAFPAFTKGEFFISPTRDKTLIACEGLATKIPLSPMTEKKSVTF
jgi:hypothetical protein